MSKKKHIKLDKRRKVSYDAIMEHMLVGEELCGYIRNPRTGNGRLYGTCALTKQPCRYKTFRDTQDPDTCPTYQEFSRGERS